MSFTLGFDPVPMTLVVQAGSAFVAQLVLSTGQWATGDDLELRFDEGDPWAATLSGSTASWEVPAATVDTLIAAAPGTVGLWYVAADGTALRWARGSVEVRA